MREHVRFWVLCLLVLSVAALWGACGPTSQTTQEKPGAQEKVVSQDGGPVGDKPSSATCVPGKEAWNNHAKGLFTKYCGQCHGEQPNFGAPYSLLNFDAILAGEVGKRKVDYAVASMSNGNMPPKGYPRPPHNDLDTMVEWASCGKKHADHTVGLQASAPVFMAPNQAPKDWEHFDLLAPKFAVGEKTLDLYQCFTFDAPVQKDRFIRRIEIKIDESRVLHHVVLLRDDGTTPRDKTFQCKGLPANADYLYAWAPGTGAIQFPDGGLRVKSGQRFLLQIHYNNGAGVKDVADSSGVRMYHSAPEGTEYGMFSPGPLGFRIPKGETKSITGFCKLNAKMKIIAGMPHMHEIGSEFHQDVIRKDGTKEVLIDLKGWSFESQFFYNTPVDLNPGDQISTTCTFKNTTDKDVTSGSNTADEMCFNFFYATPPPSVRFCDGADSSKEVEYTPEKCAPKDAPATLAQVAGKFYEGAPKPFKGGKIPAGRWVLKEMKIFVPTAKTPVGEIDLAASSVPSKGQLYTGDLTVLDVKNRIALVLKGNINFDRDNHTSISGKLTNGTKPEEATLTPDCGGDKPIQLMYEVDGNTLRIATTSKFSVLTLTSEFTFTLAK